MTTLRTALLFTGLLVSGAATVNSTRIATERGSLIQGAIALPAALDTISAGGYHVVRVRSGRVDGLGDGTYGQLGSNPTGIPVTLAGLTGIAQVAAGGFSTLALGIDGTVWFLGESTLQHTTPHGTPNPIAKAVPVAGLKGIDAIAAGHRHFLALDHDGGKLYAWGHNGSGQVGNGRLRDVVSPVLVLIGVTSIAAGDGFSLAIKSDNTVWSWGRNRHGQLGHGDSSDRASPTLVLGVSKAQAIAAGGQHSLILLANKTVLTTGNSAFGQLGLGTTSSKTSPKPVAGLSGIIAIAAGYHHSAALNSSGQVSVWGRNFEGQCGGGATSPVQYLSPHALTLPAAAAGVLCGYHFTVFELVDRRIWGTGSNSDGQLDGKSIADQDDSQKILVPQSVPLIAAHSATVIRIGTGCIANGQPPGLYGARPVIGKSGQLLLFGGSANEVGVTLVGIPHPGKSVGHGCQLYVDLAIPTVSLYFTTTSSGVWVSTPFPLAASLLGVSVGGQSAIRDLATPPFGLALSNGIVLRIGY